MKSLIKDRKTLSLVLCLVLICVFTLTVAYSALTTILTINGNARVSAADWDIYLNNPRVTSGSATTNVPEIKTSSTLEFSTTLNMPGDFYEFVVDVVNGGDIDAMIENVVKTPELTVEQAKFLKYEVSYQNGEAITTKQLLAKDTTMPIKVRIEYRKDLNNTDLPTGQVVLDLSLTLEYIQSDGSGSSVNNNGVQVVSANGNINDIGTIVTIGTEQFYTIGIEDNNVKLLAMYNLYVGGKYSNGWVAYGNEVTGKQDSSMIGNGIGVLRFSNVEYWLENWSLKSEYYNRDIPYVYDNNSLLFDYIENYKNYLNSLGLSNISARLISVEELNDIGCKIGNCTDCYSWIKSTSYWTGSSYEAYIYNVYSGGIGSIEPYYDAGFGVRPVVVISKDYFN